MTFQSFNDFLDMFNIELLREKSAITFHINGKILAEMRCATPGAIMPMVVTIHRLPNSEFGCVKRAFPRVLGADGEQYVKAHEFVSFHLYYGFLAPHRPEKARVHSLDFFAGNVALLT